MGNEGYITAINQISAHGDDLALTIQQIIESNLITSKTNTKHEENLLAALKQITQDSLNLCTSIVEFWKLVEADIILTTDKLTDTKSMLN